jgi:hypothetical protein
MTASFRFQVSSFQRLAGALLALAAATGGMAEDFAALTRDRTAIELVYYHHRLGQKPPFEQISPPTLIRQLVQDDLHKEAVLRRAYGIEITAAMLEAEVQRINTTTRAPEMLAEIKAALGTNSARFANAFAKPILVERILREKFENDDALHAPARRMAEQARQELLAARTNGADCEKLLALLRRSHSNTVTETTWQLGPRPAETNAPDPDLLAGLKRFGPNAQILSTPRAPRPDLKFYFEDLPGELQTVLRVQLRRPGDISAVIEMPGGFLLFVARERTDAALSVAGLSLPKRSYEQWLTEPEAGIK